MSRRRQEILEHRVAVLGGDAFRVELHAMDRQRCVAQAHDDAIFRLGGNEQILRQILALDDKRVIARRLEREGNPRKTLSALWLILLTCHASALARAAPRRRKHADSLMAEANAEKRDFACAASLMRSRQIPACSGRAGPGKARYGRV